MFSMSKNDHFIIWLAPWAGKMNRILRCDWLPEQERWRYLAGLPGAVWILASFFLLCKFIDLDSVSVYKHAKKKKNWVDAQPSWPYAGSITDIHWTICSTLLLVLNTRGTIHYNTLHSYPSFLFQLSIIPTPSLYMAKESLISRLSSRVHTSYKQFCQVGGKIKWIL